MNAAADLGQIERILREAVEEPDLPASFRALLYQALQQDGKVLAGTPRPRWPAIVLATAAAVGGNRRAANVAAAAVELFIASLDILDEIEDGDHSPLAAAAGQAAALNVSTALLLLAQHALRRLPAAGVPPERLPRFLETLTGAGLLATGGQHLDLAAEGQAQLSTDEALEIARRKAGALVAGACRLGALTGTDDEEVLALYETWGRHYGTSAQLANDLHDAGNAGRKTDLRRGKGTLPLIFDRHSADPAVPPGAGQLDEAAAVEQLRTSGALHFTWVVLEIERQACHALLDQLAARGHAVAGLRELLA